MQGGGHDHGHPAQDQGWAALWLLQALQPACARAGPVAAAAMHFRGTACADGLFTRDKEAREQLKAIVGEEFKVTRSVATGKAIKEHMEDTYHNILKAGACAVWGCTSWLRPQQQRS